MKDNKILIGTALVLLLLLKTGLSYAYFSTSVKGNDNAKDVIVEAGTLKLTYTDGPAINVQHIKPGWSTTKEVSVKNNGTLDAYYSVIWQSLTNTITNNELVLSATCQRLNASGTVEGTCESISQAPISDMIIAKKYQ
ncbi:MAG: CalY family protein [Clostridium sp.]|nr:MAG: CalY family protein [Clostridium sp.]